MNHDEKADKFAVDKSLESVDAAGYDALLQPGGVANPDRLRMIPKAVQFVKDFHEQNKPMAAICHGPWMLVEADAVRGRSLTSWPSLKTDIRNAGEEWVDRPVQVDQRLVTSRNPDDLPKFCAKVLDVFEDAIEERRVDTVVEQTFPASDPPPGPVAPS
jgi:protease I